MSLRENPLVVNGEPYDHNSFIGTVQGAMYSPSSDEKGYLAIANVTASLLDGHLDFKKAKMMKRDNPVDTSSVLGIITSVNIANRYPFKTYEQWKAQADKLESTAPYYAQGYSTSNG